MIKKLSLLFLIFLFPFQLFGNQIIKNIFLLNSYHQGYSWTDRLNNSIRKYLDEGNYKINLVVEYLDSKRFKPDSQYFDLVKGFFDKKYKNNKFDLVITTDDDAFFFLKKYHKELFPKVPVVSCGLGQNNEGKVIEEKYFTAIYDDYKNEEAFLKSLELFPNTENLVFISDMTTTGRSSTETMKALVSNLKKINCIFISDDSIEEIIDKINSLPFNTIVYPLIFNYDKNGKYYSHSEFVRLLSNSIPYPIIASTEEQIGAGALGGYIISTDYHGKITAELALRILKGENIKDISFSMDSLVLPVFDQHYLEKFSVSETSLPERAIIINKQLSFFEQNKKTIILVSLIFIFLLGVLLVLSINIFKRIQSENKLKKFSLAVEQSPASIVITDTNGTIEYVNKKFTDITGYTRDEVIGRNPSILKSGLTPIEVYHNLWDTITSGNIWQGEICNKKKNGELYWERLLISPLLNSFNRITHFIGVIEDITERKINEQKLKESKQQLENTLLELKQTQEQVLQQERLRSIGHMASGIAHDINNSLMPILGYADLLLFKKGLDPSTEKKIQSIKTASLDIKRTIERLKDFYKPSFNEIDFKNVSINNSIINAIEFTKHKWKDMAEIKGNVINISTNLDQNLPDIRGNDTEIREVLINLILNSADSMPKGGDISIESRLIDNEVIVEISDTGTGMDDYTLKHCFDPFFTTKGDQGSGLGLSVVYGIMQRHKGNIEIASKVGAGSKITLHFPVDSQISEVNFDETINEEIPSLRILCIDDNKEAREILNIILTEKKHKVELCDSGKEGIDEFIKALEKGIPYDIVITDLGMPYMDGKSVAEAIKSKSPNTPIILLTGWGSFLEPDSLKSIDYILKKPITNDDIDVALRKVMKRK